MHRRLRQIVRRSRRLLMAIAVLAYLVSSFPIPVPAHWVARPATPCGALICRCDEALKRKKQCCCFGAVKSCCRKAADRSGTPDGQRRWVLNSRPCGGDDRLNAWLNTGATVPPPRAGCVFAPRAVDWLRPFPLSALSRLAPPRTRPPRLSA